MKKILLVFSLFAIFLTGCKKDVITTTTGDLSINLSSEGEFTAVSKAETNPDAVDINEFSINISNSSTGASVKSWGKLSDVPQVIAMEPNSYKIEATSPGKKDVAWNQPIYYGTQNFTVSAGKVVNINLVCKLKNMKVTVKCTDNFIEELNSDFTVKVSSEYGYLEFTKEIIDKGTSMAGYFTVSPLTVDIKGTRKLDNSTVSHYFKIASVAEKDHHVITVDANETGEVGIGSGVSVDYTVNNKDVDIQVGDLEENPVEDDLTGTPIFQSSSVNSGDVVAKTVGSITLNYSLPVALAQNHGIALGAETITASASGKVVTVSFGELAEGTSYTLNIPAGAIVNSTDNSQAAAQSITFSTQAAQQEVPITFAATGGINAPAVYPYGTFSETFTIDITADKGIDKFPVEIKSAAFKAMILELDNGCTEKVDLANMSAAEEEFWGGLFGKTSAQIKNATSIQFSIGSFIGMMPVGTHPIEMTVNDKEGNTKTVTITFQING
jgi:hypothetical protein